MKNKDLTAGNKVEINSEPYLILESTFMNPGRGQAFHKLKLKNMLNNSIITKTTKVGERLKEADVESKLLKYLYKNDNILFFYDEKTFDYYELHEELSKNLEKWIKEGLIYEIIFWNNNIIEIKNPKFIELKVISADVYDKKSCASKTYKNAILETGMTIKVPVFIKENDIIKIDTEKEEYISRI
ncbi:MAG TPA: elongation factor P [Candidatus Azoamicus sp.]